MVEAVVDDGPWYDGESEEDYREHGFGLSKDASVKKRGKGRGHL